MVGVAAGDSSGAPWFQQYVWWRLADIVIIQVYCYCMVKSTGVRMGTIRTSEVIVIQYTILLCAGFTVPLSPPLAIPRGPH